MKPFTKRLALVMGLLFTALLCLGIVYIDTVNNYWQFSGGFIRLVVNTNAQAIMTVDTNTMSIGFNTNNTARSFVVIGRQPAPTATGNGASAAASGAIQMVAGVGGDAGTNDLARTGGIGGAINFNGGPGGSSPNTASNAIGGAGGTVNFTSGAGGSTSSATNATTGGAGGNMTFTTSSGGVPAQNSTNTVTGNGGNLAFVAGGSPIPTGGTITKKTGNGGAITFTAGSSGDGQATNSGTGGGITMTAGNSGGGAGTAGAGAPGAIAFTAGTSGAGTSANPSPGGNVSFTAGDGSTGTTNSNGGRVHLIGGAPGSGAVPGDVVIARNTAGTSRGGLQVGPLQGGATMTNLLSGTATLDFPSTAAGTVSDLPITVAGAADGDVVSLAVPIASVTNCVWMAWASNGVVYVRAANAQLVTAQDPNSGVFRVKVEKFR